MEQYQALVRAIPAINAALAKLGHTVSDVEPQEIPPEVSKKASSSKEKKAKAKANIEATSDEEED